MNPQVAIRFFRNLCEKARTYLVTIMKRKCVISPACPFKSAMRATLPSNGPSDPQQSGQQLLSLDRTPTAHEMEKTCAKGPGTFSP